MNIKNILFKYGDKAIFLVFLLILLWSTLKLVSSQNANNTDVVITSANPPVDQELAVESNSVALEQRITKPPYPDAGNDIATDPEKLEPREGEKACKNCGYIYPATLDRCPYCGGGEPTENIYDKDRDGLPDKWEMKYFKNLDQGPNDDPDGDGYTNMDEYLGGSDPTDAQSVPQLFVIAEIGQKPVDILFKGFIVHEGGDKEIPNPAYWAVEINWGRGSQTKIIPYQGYFHGYKLAKLHKIVEMRKLKGIDELVPFDVWFLTIQKKGRKDIVIRMNTEGHEQEPYARLKITRGTDKDKTTGELYDGDKFTVNGDEYTLVKVTESEVVVLDKKNKITTLAKGT
jgi:hypothetical protein